MFIPERNISGTREYQEQAFTGCGQGRKGMSAMKETPDTVPDTTMRRRDRAVDDDEWICQFLAASPYAVPERERLLEAKGRLELV